MRTTVGQNLEAFSVALVISTALGVSGCSPGGGAKPPASKTTPSLAFGAEPGITYGTALSATQLNATSYGVAGTYTYTPAAGTVLNAGTQTLSASFMPADTDQYNGPVTATTTIVVAKATPIITWGTPAAITSATPLGSSQLNAMAGVPGTFTYTPAAGAILSAGTQTLSVSFTPTDTTDYSPVTATVSIVVTLAPPTITGLNYATIYCEETSLDCQPTVQISGTNFAAGDILLNGLFGNLTLGAGSPPNLIDVHYFWNNYVSSPGWFPYQDCRPNLVTCSNTVSLAFFGSGQNTLAVSASGQLFQNDEAQGNAPPAVGGTGINGYVREFQANGATLNAVGSLQYGESDTIAYDDTTSRIVLGDLSFTTATYFSFEFPYPDGCGTNNIIAIGAKNGYAVLTCPAANLFGAYPIAPNVTANYITLGSQPSSLAMGTTGTELDAFVFSRDGVPTLWKVSVLNAIVKGSVSLPAITPITTVQTANPFAGGWQVAYGQGGSADQTVAVLSTPDNLLVFVNAATMQTTKSVTLSGIPFRVVYDATHGTFIVASVNVANTTTTFASVNPSTGTVTNMASTSSLLAVGLAVSPDGKYLYICMRASCETQPNQ